MNMQRIIKTTMLALTAIGVLGISAPLMAERVKMHFSIDRMAEHLELDAAQTEAIGDLFGAHRDAMQEIEWRTADGERNPEAREQARAARVALHEEIKALLNDEQIEKFDAMPKRVHRRGHRHSMRGALAELNLSDEQQTAIDQLMREHRGKRRGERGQLRQAIHEVLTDEQIAQLDAVRKRRHAGPAEDE